MHLARSFDRVVSIEPDELLAQLAAFNMRVLGVSNIDVRHTTAENFVGDYEGPPFDLAYVDPDRRDESGKRKYGLAEGSPDIVALAPALLAMAKTVLVKASPMCDLTEGARLLPDVRRAIVLADSTECKEVLFELRTDDALSGESHSREARFLYNGERFAFQEPERKPPARPVSGSPSAASGSATPLLESAPDSGRLLEPNVSLYKAGLVDAYFNEACPFPDARATSAGGYLWTPARPAPGSFPGKVFRIEASFPYKTGPLRAALRERGVTAAHFTRKNFDLRLEDVRRSLRLREGGDRFLVLTRLRGGDRYAFLAALES
ncbi:MAG: hypothetical protein HKN20_08055 [Gemmatimonadetes bacterium]|nr:hypothetical protein [Gemmatimonadota bacterium]